jgi:hypothetical protein
MCQLIETTDRGKTLSWFTANQPFQSAVTLRSRTSNGWLAVNQDNVYPRTVVSISCHRLKQQSVGRHYPDSQPTSRYLYSLMWQTAHWNNSPWVNIILIHSQPAEVTAGWLWIRIMSTHGLLFQSAVTLSSKSNGWLAVNQDNVYPRTDPDSQPTSRYLYYLMWQFIETTVRL